jgi:hypothetical protein
MLLESRALVGTHFGCYGAPKSTCRRQRTLHWLSSRGIDRRCCRCYRRAVVDRPSWIVRGKNNLTRIAVAHRVRHLLQADLIDWLANQKRSNIMNKLAMTGRFRSVRLLARRFHRYTATATNDFHLTLQRSCRRFSAPASWPGEKKLFFFDARGSISLLPQIPELAPFCVPGAADYRVPRKRGQVTRIPVSVPHRQCMGLRSRKLSDAAIEGSDKAKKV